MAYLQFHNVSKIFEESNGSKTTAVKEADFSVEAGELVVFVGPSGCGKSTLLRMIAGLEEISKGKIILENLVLNDLEVKDRGIAMVFQDYALYPHMTVSENLSFGLENIHLPKQQQREKVENSLSMLELTDLAERFPRALSGGQRQRVALGRALVKEPKLFLLDEPLSNLDARLRVQTRKLISELHKKLKATMIYVTHDQVEAMTLGDKIVVMNQGKIQQVGTPEEIYQNPKNTFVASFIGTPSMNLIQLDLNQPLTEPFIQIEEEIKNICDKNKLKEVVVGIRPEAIKLEINSEGLLPEMVEYLGSENLVYFKLANGEIIVKESIAKRLHSEIKYQLILDQENVYFFDSQSGLRI